MNSRTTSTSPDAQAQRLHQGCSKRWACLLALLAAPVTSLLAHPGHGHELIVAPSQPAHWFIEPEHAVTWMLLGVLTWTAYRLLQQRTVRTEPVTESDR
ncbi:MAG: hypothetical protein JNM99_11785 [Verrucomicrobiaceae bacterium]|nr:hypothetical protein [Verrucomicrobiaceae bacterium]